MHAVFARHTTAAIDRLDIYPRQAAANVKHHHCHIGNVCAVFLNRRTIVILDRCGQLGGVPVDLQQRRIGIHRQPAGAVAFAGVGVQFSGAYALGNVGNLGMASSSPAITLPDSAVPADPVGSSVVITQGHGLGSYLVAEHQPDGSGVSTLVLEAAP